jgi:hypothetical protein
MPTVSEIQATIEAEVSTNIPSLTSTSKTAIWRLWCYIVAIAHYTLYKFWDSTKADFDALAAKRAAGTVAWLSDKIKQFQYGYVITVIDYNATYLDTTSAAALAARIVKYVAITESNGSVLAKVAKDNSGDLTPLISAELTSLTSYVNKIKFAGVSTTVISLNPDLLKALGTVYFDGQVLLTDITANVEAAINNYLKGIEFDGVFNKNKYIDAVQSVTGVKDFVPTTIEIRPDSGSFLSVVKDYYPSSGYYAIDGSFPLSSGLIYVAQ